MRNNLHNETSFIDCLHVITKYLASDSKSIPKIEKKNNNNNKTKQKSKTWQEKL